MPGAGRLRSVPLLRFLGPFRNSPFVELCAFTAEAVGRPQAHAISATCPRWQPRPPPAARISVLRTVVGLSDIYQSHLLSMEAALCAGDISLFSPQYQRWSLCRWGFLPVAAAATKPHLLRLCPP